MVKVVAVGDELVDDRQPIRHGLHRRLLRVRRFYVRDIRRHLLHLRGELYRFGAHTCALVDERRRGGECVGIVALLIILVDRVQFVRRLVGIIDDRLRDDGPLWRAAVKFAGTAFCARQNKTRPYPTAMMIIKAAMILVRRENVDILDYLFLAKIIEKSKKEW